MVKALNDFPDVWDELRGAYYLRWRDGEGSVRLLASEGRLMLLEHAGERHLSDALDTDGDDAATEIAAEVLGRLLSDGYQPSPIEFQSLRDRFAELFARAEKDRAAGIASAYLDAARLASRLLDEPAAEKPLHGDLHHDNILFGPRGWLAIDPKGVLGDPAFDAANLFYNPLERTELCRSPERIAFMSETFGKVLGQNPAAILDHAIAYGCLSASWHASDANAVEEARELSIAEAIRSVRLSF